MMQRKRTGLLFAGVSAVAVSASASQAAAHLCLDVPVSRVGPNCQRFEQRQKAWPCGIAGRSKHVTTYRSGETIEVEVRSTIPHSNSWYRVSFNADGDNFEDPTSFDDRSGKHPGTLVDGVPMTRTDKQTFKVTLPNVSCDNCTLQVIQVMGDKVARGFGGGQPGTQRGDDIYYACADIVLKGEPVGGTTAPSTATPDASTDAPSDAAPTTTQPDASASEDDDAVPDEPLALEVGDVPDGVEGTTEGLSEGCSLGAGRSDATSAAWLLVGLGALLARLRRQRRQA